MTFAIFQPPLAPSIGSGVDRAARLIENQFGDGYRQTGKDGLNAVVSTMSVEWEALSTDQANYIDQFLIANVGLPFNWAPPFSAINYIWDCKAWRRENVYGPIDKITATFVQRFDLQ